MGWKTYAGALLLFNLIGLLFLYLLLRIQHLLPLNPQELGSVSPDLAFNIAVSFATNTNWQSYGGETTLSYLSQMLGLTVQNFLSAATGMAVLVALIRGIARHTTHKTRKFLGGSDPLHALYPFTSGNYPGNCTGLAGCGADLPALPGCQTSGSGSQVRSPRYYRLDRPPRRLRSNSWERMAVVISMSTRHIRSRIPPRSPISWKCLPSCSSRLR